MNITQELYHTIFLHVFFRYRQIKTPSTEVKGAGNKVGLAYDLSRLPRTSERVLVGLPSAESSLRRRPGPRPAM